MRGPAGHGDTASRILDVAERLVQVRGFNGFSYADVAAELGVTKASLHYHFPGKAELGRALVQRYASRFSEALATLDARGATARTKLDAYADLYVNVLRDGRMCLCGMLAAEYPTLPPPMQAEVVRFFDDNEQWLERVLLQAHEEGSARYTGSARESARIVLGALEGAMLVARPRRDVTRFETAARLLMEGLAATASSAPS